MADGSSAPGGKRETREAAARAEQASAPGQPLVVGRVGPPHGVRGLVHVHSFLEPPEQLFDYRQLWLRRPQGWQQVALAEARAQGRRFVARLADVRDRDLAETLRGCDLAVEAQTLPPTEPGEYYWRDLLGLRVETLDGTALGAIEALMETGANDVLVLRGERERLVPFVMDTVVHRVDLAAGVVVVDWHPDD